MPLPMHSPTRPRLRAPSVPARARSADGAPFWAGALSGTLDALAPHLPPALAAPGALRRVREVAAALPAALTDELYLECRLAADEPRVDLVLHLRDGGMELAAGRNPGVELSPALRVLPAWSRLRGFCTDRTRPESPLRRGVAAIWLELDVHRGEADVHEPGVFLDVRWLGERGTPPDEWSALAGGWLERLGGSPTAAAEESISRCLRALPAGACMTYAGLFPGRDGPQVRLCASGVAAEALPRFLADAGWPGSRSALAELVPAMAPLATPGVVHLDLDGGGVAPRLGWELKLDRRPQLSGGVREGALLTWLVEAGLADVAKTEALQEWPGWTVETLPHQLWESVLVRRVNHLKLVLEPDGAPRAKAYLYAGHAPRHPRSAR